MLKEYEIQGERERGLTTNEFIIYIFFKASVDIV